MAVHLREDDIGGSASRIEGYWRVQGIKSDKKAFIFLYNVLILLLVLLYYYHGVIFLLQHNYLM